MNVTLNGTDYPLRFGPHERDDLARFTDLPSLVERLRTGRTAALDGFTVILWAMRGGGYDGDVAPLLGAEIPGGKRAGEKLALQLIEAVE